MQDDNEYLALQLYGLECRLQRGEHLQAGGEQLMREYRRLKATQGKGLRKPKKDHSAVDQAMADQVATCTCATCGGQLKQARSGSLRAICQACGERWEFELAKAPEPQKLTPAKECRECGWSFVNHPESPKRDSGCGICVECMGDLESELLDNSQ